MSLSTKLLALLFAMIISAGIGYRTGVKLTQAAIDKAAITAIETARNEEKQNAARVQSAQSNQVAKLRIVERDSAGTLSELERLRNALRAKPTGDATLAALTERADTLGELFGQCGQALTDLGRKADGHAIDVITLRDAWPK
ncbi:hypothetical protein UFOVP607_7 [uncultured Caudovirales phage]|uniref:Uncharacterized protein n=1 Tax=uncultured Caudovirales phage TaxID=2100421 RepID=A0A6J5N0Y4_9CAUD|nr:hypothetical protein UFOVP607_7 [uncultured Caudovirales phage]